VLLFNVISIRAPGTAWGELSLLLRRRGWGQMQYHRTRRGARIVEGSGRRDNSSDSSSRLVPARHDDCFAMCLAHLMRVSREETGARVCSSLGRDQQAAPMYARLGVGEGLTEQSERGIGPVQVN
jgi:hypothetical protein